MTSDDDVRPLGPVPSNAWLRDHREQLIAKAEANEARAHEDWARTMMTKAEDELRAWQALPCRGEVAQAGKCPDEYQATCERRDWRICPRRQIEIVAEEEQQKRTIERRRHLERGIPERVMRVVFDGKPEQTDALVRLRKSCERSPEPIITVLSGGVGCGKSVAAGWWAVTVAARFITAAELSKLSPYEDEGSMVQKSRNLVIDDLGAEYMDPKGFFASNLDALINHRYANDLRTVVTTNIERPNFRPRYGDRIADRIKEAGAFLECGGVSLRKRK